VNQRTIIINKLKAVLGTKRFKHSLRVEKIAVLLARKYRVSTKKASLAALLHDYARQFDRQELLRQATKFKLGIDPVSRFEPKLLHAELSALLAKKDFGISQKDILEAIRKHTIGAPRMTSLEKIIYLADHIEEGRNFTGVSKVRRLAQRDLDKAVVEATANMLKFLLEEGLPIHPGTIETRNYYLMK